MKTYELTRKRIAIFKTITKLYKKTKEPVRITDIAKTFLVSHAAMHIHMNALEAMGFVTRHARTGITPVDNPPPLEVS